MTPEEIKKIAEEYATSIIDPIQIDGSIPNVLTISKDSAKKSFAEMYIPFLQFITKRFYLVEKGKAEREYENCIYLSVNHPKTSERRIAKSVADELKSLFGPDIRKEEEECDK